MKDKDKVLEFKCKTQICNEIPPIEDNKIANEMIPIDLGEEFIDTEENISRVLSLLYFYKALGLCDDAAMDALYCFADLFGECLGWIIPEEEPEDNK
jgi:hypothetical protein